MTKIYTNGKKFGARMFKGAWADTAHIEGEQYRRAAKRNDEEITVEPSFWGVVNVNTNRLQRVAKSRAEARSMRKPNEKVVAGWV